MVIAVQYGQAQACKGEERLPVNDVYRELIRWCEQRVVY